MCISAVHPNDATPVDAVTVTTILDIQRRVHRRLRRAGFPLFLGGVDYSVNETEDGTAPATLQGQAWLLAPADQVHNAETALRRVGTDPGSLLASTYIPKNFPKSGPLVIVLHGSTQSAEKYNTGSVWSKLSEECGMALLFPGQKRCNNATGGLHWFKPGDSQRDGGEPLSIRQMIGQVVEDHAVDPSRVFITGLSSGGAMTSMILATYPEIFAGGAIIAGLPYRSADDLTQALFRMKGYGGPSDRKLNALVRAASEARRQRPDRRQLECRVHRPAVAPHPRSWRVADPGGEGRWGSPPGLVRRCRARSDRGIHNRGDGPRHADQRRGRRGPWRGRKVHA